MTADPNYEFMDEHEAMDEIDRIYNEGVRWDAIWEDGLTHDWIHACDLSNALGTTWGEIEMLPEVAQA